MEIVLPCLALHELKFQHRLVSGIMQGRLYTCKYSEMISVMKLVDNIYDDVQNIVLRKTYNLFIIHILKPIL